MAVLLVISLKTCRFSSILYLPIQLATFNVFSLIFSKSHTNSLLALSCLLYIFFRGGLENNSFWTSTNTGCETVTMNGSVLCSCNHLTHFAILLSPGVVRERKIVCVKEIVEGGVMIILKYRKLCADFCLRRKYQKFIERF